MLTNIKLKEMQNETYPNEYDFNILMQSNAILFIA